MIEKFIESEANAKFKRWKKLARDARAVRKERATLMEGIHLMQVALESGCRVNAVLIDADRASREARELALELCRKSGADLFALSPALYDQLSPVEHGVGVMCEAAVPPAPADDGRRSRHEDLAAHARTDPVAVREEFGVGPDAVHDRQLRAVRPSQFADQRQSAPARRRDRFDFTVRRVCHFELLKYHRTRRRDLDAEPLRPQGDTPRQRRQEHEQKIELPHCGIS